MTNIESPLGGAGHEAREDHAFDDEVRRAAQQFAVLEGARLALVGVADDILDVASLGPDGRPFAEGREAGASHAAQVRGLDRFQDGVAVARLDEAAHHVITRDAVIDIDLPTARFAVAMLVRQLLAGGCGPHAPANLVLRQPPIDVVVDRHGRRRRIALPQARRPFDVDLLGIDLVGERHQLARQARRTAHMAGHIAANLHLHTRRRRQLEVRIKARHLVDRVQRLLNAPGQRTQLLGRQIAATFLDGQQFLDDHRVARIMVRVLFSPGTPGEGPGVRGESHFLPDRNPSMLRVAAGLRPAAPMPCSACSPL